MRPTGRSRQLLLAAVLSIAAPSWAQTRPQLQGDVGAAVFRTPAITRSAGRTDVVLPYVYADFGPLFARVDTFGYKVVPMGRGHLELAARVSFEGYRPSNPAFDERSAPLPIGLGTFQETHYGAFFLYGFGDPVSGGTLLDASYAAEFGVGPVRVYPQVGLERRSARYVQHLYGISAAEAARSGAAGYRPGSSLAPSAAIAVDYELTPSLNLTGQVRRRWLDRSITASPLVAARTQTTSLLALTRTFR